MRIIHVFYIRIRTYFNVFCLAYACARAWAARGVCPSGTLRENAGIPKLERRFRKVGIGSQTSDALLGDEVELRVAHDWKRFQQCMIVIALRQVAGGEPLRRGVIIKARLINPWPSATGPASRQIGIFTWSAHWDHLVLSQVEDTLMAADRRSRCNPTGLPNTRLVIHDFQNWVVKLVLYSNEFKLISNTLNQTLTVASPGLVSPGALFFSWKTDDLFCSSLSVNFIDFTRASLDGGCSPALFLRIPHRYSTIIYKGAHKFFSFGCHPLEGVTRGNPLP